MDSGLRESKPNSLYNSVRFSLRQCDFFIPKIYLWIGGYGNTQYHTPFNRAVFEPPIRPKFEKASVMKNLTILNTSIRTFNNLYSLNDFHKASGAKEHLRPSKFVRNDQTQELIKEVESQSPDLGLACKSLRGGINSGVWACEELVLSYAMWISPKFHLIVLRAFLAMHRGEVKPQQLALPQPNYNMSNIAQSEEVLALLIQMYSHLFQAHEMQEKLQNTSIAKLMENQIGGQYLYNFKHPLEQTMAKAKKFIQSNTERLALVKAMDNLLN
ncbi:TPA: KilA-N domain-containing protein [Pasteurella multocida]|nr:KilA-N domain-containing protein [Pasteurella multocida]HDR1694819.1 KilA-N domain-containing protein [Pasteurella multocida]HDR1699533.1 KilA-N domain-containing protein [Pasteurella multocida]HDR1701440.1 KilA-N domain-containing protein [Pasteurella multocida]HDR1704934.1 KilA-N domain-containing protein [Pasteurella multocida]